VNALQLVTKLPGQIVHLHPSEVPWQVGTPISIAMASVSKHKRGIPVIAERYGLASAGWLTRIL